MKKMVILARILIIVIKSTFYESAKSDNNSNSNLNIEDINKESEKI